MLTHKQVWDGIDRLAARHKLSASGLAKKAGLDPTTFNKSKRITKQGKPRWPSTESISKVLEATGTSMQEFVELMMGATPGSPVGRGFRLRCTSLSEVEKGTCLDAAGFPQPGAWEEIEYPAIEDEHAYALELDRDVAPPFYRTGDILVVSPGSSIRRGDRALARLRDGRVTFGLVQRRTAQRVVLTELVSGAEVVIEADRLAWLARILWVSQ
ncbi:MAG: helix-turn-helix transcriptional regulator [Geminicoccaceae bacterium]|nr:helix-turn-helix transcriptional regulator [Geminicoccaceae bacterium]MCS7267601.1 helix-turn-helix transcriptional regulator [Geminicoccaceae bacterium]MCX7630651.1 helix-turn-helix transcriptional regulator [Geminicoccaceae bacterium]MDW8123159.1 helix-turn-helix transcriptional regulator [Geminicoccaceae bacterium]MDW8340181.1 helix-turn-helix transcriptional regulator [Geminicoccaceae bacterium]